MLASQEFGLILANLTAWLAILLLDPQHNFASVDSARLLLREGVLLGIYAIGAAIVIVAGGIDLSTGSVIAFSGVICAMLLRAFGGESLAAHQPLPSWVIASWPKLASPLRSALPRASAARSPSAAAA